MLDNIPKELATVKQWTHSLSEKEPKRPAYTKYKPEGGLSLTEAWEKVTDTTHVGFYTTKQDSFIIGDIDHIEDPEDLSLVPIEISNLLMNCGAYSEVSPSGKGIRFVLKLKGSKSSLYKDIYYHKKKGREIQLNVGPPWLTITGNTTSYSSYTIGEIDLPSLEDVFTIRKEEDITGCASTPINPPPMNEVFNALHRIPLDQNPRIMRAFRTIFEEPYTHYVFWLKVIMAIHNYASITGTRADCLEQVIKWSSTDPESYEGEGAVMDKWNSLSRDDNPVGYRTLFGLYYACVIKWPKPKPQNEKQKLALLPIEPLNTEYVNFVELLRFYGMTIYRDIHSPVKFYLSADEDIITKYFGSLDTKMYLDKYRGVFSEKALISAFNIMCQDKGFAGISYMQVQMFLKNTIFQANKEVDIVREYFNTPFDQLPESYRENNRFYSISTVEYMFKCLTIDFQTKDPDMEYDLYETYYKSWLMGLVRSLFYRNSFHMNNCVLLLTGPEQIRKTSHFKFMLPSFMRSEYIAFTPHGFDKETSMRDVVKLASENLLVVWDEVEQYLNRKSESNFKKIIDNNPQKFIDKYEVIATEVIPMAMYGATSNKSEFNLSDTGSRRLYQIPVSWVDTDSLNKVCWHRVVNDLRKEIEEAPCDDPPWLLTRDQLAYQAQLHQKITNVTGMEFILSELYEWSAPSCIRTKMMPKGQTNPKISRHCMTFPKIKMLVSAEMGSLLKAKEQLALRRSLVKMCGRYTKTKGKSMLLTKPRLQVKDGQMVAYGVTYFIVPKRRRNE